jgi:ribosome-associated heat shock protein Hsp15
MSDIRIDKFIWAVRFYKTRSIGSEAVKSGQVLLNDAEVKPAQTIKVGDEIKVKRNPIWRTYKIKKLLKNRVSAKLVENYIDEITPESEIEKLELMKLMPGFDRQKGAGRPTKKERRTIDKFNKW